MKKAISLILAMIPSAVVALEPVSLFNGTNLDGWTIDIPSHDGKEVTGQALPSAFVVREGLLVSLGTPRGHLISNASFSDYRLLVEYRFPSEPGNCGVLVHASVLRYRNNMFPKSIEIQMQHGNAGEFWCIGENIEVPEMEARRPRSHPEQAFGGEGNDARRILKLAEGAEKPAGEWNAMEIVCRGQEIIVTVNGILVNHGFKSTAASGKIVLQAEGAVVEFRKLELTPLGD